MAAQSKAWTVFARWNTMILGLNPTQVMDVCVRLFCVEVAALWRADHLSKESYRMYKNQKTEKAGKDQRAVEP
jgi:hypothetical protein